MTRPAPGTPIIQGQGPEQAQQRLPSSYATNMRLTAAGGGNAFNDPVATAGDPQDFAPTTNIDAVAGAPAGIGLWPTQGAAALNLDGASPA